MPEKNRAAILSAELVRAIENAHQALPDPPSRMGVALSAGPDSAMMALHAAEFAKHRGIEVHCLHVHHGLQDAAEEWQDRAHDLARRLGLACHSRRICVRNMEREGMEAAARSGRYEALRALARQANVDHVLLAHHRGDQAETVLLRLLRGAGPTGLAAMAPVSRRGGLVLMRPWLESDRAVILRCAEAFESHSGWRPVSDPTNIDDQYTRAAVRIRLAPQLDERWPAWEATLARHARHSAELREILDEVAATDLDRLDVSPDGSGFSLAAWRRLSAPRQALVLRHWLSGHCRHLPSDARLQELMRQLRGLHALGHDRQMRLKHGNLWICCVRGRVRIERNATQGD